jgi:hypothetical protein
MTALAKERVRNFATRKHFTFTLKSGTKAYRGAAICLELATGKVIPAVSAAGLVYLGLADDTVDATSADQELSVDLIAEMVAGYFVNGVTAADIIAVAAAHVGQVCYFQDDQTVCMSALGRPIAGRVLQVSTTKGVLVQKLDGAAEILPAPVAAVLGTYAANDLAPARVQHDAVYDVPTTGAASTITLPAGAPDGTRVYFVADGTKNAHTVTYRDATGPTALTDALTAAKRHGAEFVKRDSKWFAVSALVSP